MEILIGVIVLLVGIAIWRRIKAAHSVARVERRAPGYTAHLRDCPVCFTPMNPDSVMGEWGPCPVGSELLHQEVRGTG